MCSVSDRSFNEHMISNL